MRLFATVMGVTAGLMMGAGLGLAAEKAAPPATTSTTKAGVDAWKQGDYAKALKIWRPLAESGDADAQFNIAQAYRQLNECKDAQFLYKRYLSVAKDVTADILRLEAESDGLIREILNLA